MAVLVFPVKTVDKDAFDARIHARWRLPLGPMTDRKPTGGKVRVGYVDVLGGPVKHRLVSLAPVFDPLAVSMVPIPGWTAPVVVPCSIPNCGLGGLYGVPVLPPHYHGKAA